MTIMTRCVIIFHDAVRHEDTAFVYYYRGCRMNLCKKTFLLFVGFLSISMDEVTKAVAEASKAVDKENQKDKRNADQSVS